jgi:hypothetical protein
LWDRVKYERIIEEISMAKNRIKDESDVAEVPITKKTYAFPTESRCPRCRSLDTERTGEYEGTQYRRCRSAVCGKKYAIQGILA